MYGKTQKGITVQGAIYAYDLNQEVPQLINLTFEMKFEFHPHGISVFKKENVEIRLAVVNHTQKTILLKTLI